jgi:hypothetical protein
LRSSPKWAGMVKKNKRIADRESYLEHHAALLPLRFTFVPFGTGDAGGDVIGSPERPVLMGYVDDEATQKRFYEALLKLPWLAPDVRNAIMRELGRSPREEEARTEKARTWTLRHKVSEVEAAGGVSGQIIEDDADARGLGEVHVGEVARAGGEVVFVNLILDRSFP